MKKRLLQIILTITITTALAGTSVHAVEAPRVTDELAVGAAVLEGGMTVKEAQPLETPTEAAEPKTQEPELLPDDAEEAPEEGTPDFEDGQEPQEDAQTSQDSGENGGVTIAAGSDLVFESNAISVKELEDDQEDAEEEAGGAAYGYTNLGVARVEDHLNVRESADDSSKIIGKMENDAGCEVLDVEGNKAHIVSGSVEGYVSLDYLLTGAEAVKYADSVVKLLATVSAHGLKVRTQPGLDAEVINLVAYGEELEVLEELDGWVKVRYDGSPAYVSAEFVSVGKSLKTALNMSEFLYGEGVSDVRVELCEYAKQFVGNPYVWGGTSLTKGADCSGFVLSVFAKYGIYLPHSSRAQAGMGSKISMSEAKPGDLVFYSKGGRINHVAIYIGGGQVLHASSPKTGIRITSAYYRTPTTVRRFIYD